MRNIKNRLSLGTLDEDLGCFPFELGPQRPSSDSPPWFSSIRSLVKVPGFLHDTLSSALPLENKILPACRQTGRRLAPKLFRGEPAITKLVQFFASYHNSSQSIARLTGSGLPSHFCGVHPGHGKLAWLRVLPHQYFLKNSRKCAIHTWFPYAYMLEALRQIGEGNSLVPSPIGIPSHLATARCSELKIQNAKIKMKV